MTKEQREKHVQRLINHYNRRLDELNVLIANCSVVEEPFYLMLRSKVEMRLSRLYGTEKYGLQTQSNGLVQ